MDYFSRISFRKQANSRIVLKYKKKYICVFLIDKLYNFILITDFFEKRMYFISLNFVKLDDLFLRLGFTKEGKKGYRKGYLQLYKRMVINKEVF